MCVHNCLPQTVSVAAPCNIERLCGFPKAWRRACFWEWLLDSDSFVIC